MCKTHGTMSFYPYCKNKFQMNHYTSSLIVYTANSFSKHKLSQNCKQQHLHALSIIWHDKAIHKICKLLISSTKSRSFILLNVGIFSNNSPENIVLHGYYHTLAKLNKAIAMLISNLTSYVLEDYFIKQLLPHTHHPFWPFNL